MVIYNELYGGTHTYLYICIHNATYTGIWNVFITGKPAYMNLRRQNAHIVTYRETPKHSCKINEAAHKKKCKNSVIALIYRKLQRRLYYIMRCVQQGYIYVTITNTCMKQYQHKY